MSIRREKIYRCTLVTRSRRIVGLVRAWDAREAVSIYREDLAATGVTSRGAIQVTDLAGPPERGYQLAAS